VRIVVVQTAGPGGALGTFNLRVFRGGADGVKINFDDMPPVPIAALNLPVTRLFWGIVAPQCGVMVVPGVDIGAYVFTVRLMAC
jgi:hypothetical protein